MHPESIARLEAHIDSAIATGPLLPTAVQEKADICQECHKQANWCLIKDWEVLRIAQPRRNCTARSVQCSHCGTTVVPQQHMERAFNEVWADMVRAAYTRGSRGSSRVQKLDMRIQKLDALFTATAATQRHDDIAHGAYVRPTASIPGVTTSSAPRAQRPQRNRRTPAQYGPSAPAPPNYRLMDSTTQIAVVFHRLPHADPRSPNATAVDRLLSAASVWFNQHHNDRHTFTCTKSRTSKRTGLCRFCFPKPPMQCTAVSEIDKLPVAHAVAAAGVEPGDEAILDDSDTDEQHATDHGGSLPSPCTSMPQPADTVVAPVDASTVDEQMPIDSDTDSALAHLPVDLEVATELPGAAGLRVTTGPSTGSCVAVPAGLVVLFVMRALRPFLAVTAHLPLDAFHQPALAPSASLPFHYAACLDCLTSIRLSSMCLPAHHYLMLRQAMMWTQHAMQKRTSWRSNGTH